MEITKHLSIVLIMTLVTTIPSISAEQELSNTTAASCLLKITSDPAILPLEEDIVEYLLHSSGVAGKAAREILDTEFNDNFLNVEWLAYEEDMTNPPAGNDSYQDVRKSEGIHNNIENCQMILLRIAVNIEPVGIAAAQEFMNALIDNLRSAFTGAFDEYRNKLSDRLQLALEESDRAESEVRSMQEKLNEISDSTILDKDRILNEIDDLRRQFERIQMEQSSDEVMIETITNQIMETKRNVFQQAKEDAIINEIKRIIELKSQDVEEERKQVESGVTVRESYLREAEEKVARLRIELAQRQNELSKSTGGNLIESLNRKLAEHSLQTALNKQKMIALKQQITKAEDLLNKADDFELLSLKLDIAKQNLKEAIIWRDRMSRQIRMLQPPTVTVIGGN